MAINMKPQLVPILIVVYLLLISSVCNSSKSIDTRSTQETRNCTQAVRTVSKIMYKTQQHSGTRFCLSLWTFRCTRITYTMKSYIVYTVVNTTEQNGCHSQDVCNNCSSPKRPLEHNDTFHCEPGHTGVNCPEDLVNVTLSVTLIGNDNSEIFAFQLSVPSKNESVLPEGSKLMCNNSNRKVVLDRTITSLNTTLRNVSISKTITCCVLLPTTTEIRCVSYGIPDPNDTNQHLDTSDTQVDNTKLVTLGGVIGALLLLILLIIVALSVVLVYKIIKRKRNRRTLFGNAHEISRRDDNVEIHDASESSAYIDTEGKFTTCTYSRIPGERRVQYATIRFERKNPTPAPRVHKMNTSGDGDVKDGDGYMRLIH